MLSTKQINESIRKKMLNGIKIPHTTSYPVIRQESGKYYLAAFAFFFTYKDVKEKTFKRPTLWTIADIETGKIIHTRTTKYAEFSDASYNKKYSILPNPEHDPSEQYYEEAFALLDSVRENIVKSNEFQQNKYRRYLDMILAITPDDYERFYEDLSI